MQQIIFDDVTTILMLYCSQKYKDSLLRIEKIN